VTAGEERLAQRAHPQRLRVGQRETALPREAVPREMVGNPRVASGTAQPTASVRGSSRNR